MCLLFETVKIVNGIPENLELHDKRMNLSRQKLLGMENHLSLSDHIRVPEEHKSGIFRCRVVYGSEIISTEYISYQPLTVKTLQLVYDDTIMYDFKYLDRSRLTGWINRKLADDILIVKKGCITDSSFANIVFTDSKRWVTPDTPLLCGTMREKLLSDRTITQERVTVDRLAEFTHFRLINAMLGFNSPELPVSNIF